MRPTATSTSSRRPPVGAVRVRIRTEETVADLRGPTACEVMDPAQVDALLARLGPDPAADDSDEARDRFVNRLRRTATPVGLVLMDQSIVSGIGNIYRAELLYRAGLDPHTPGKQVPLDVARELWSDWAHLLEDGIRTGMMITRRDLTAPERAKAVRSHAERNYVYKREGLPCRVCGTHVLLEEIGARKLYWCPVCQS
ncbi:Endonuclease 8 1 [Rathayibacter tanaceti]|uniref:Endonuclease 8 1 n=1 Tax=Rathayibacter tanaceti TaxID=1671680 RepID=A0A166INL0_9MICO|nr:Endonuclease 8 1 [Rathayibacter tanaceti]